MGILLEADIESISEVQGVKNYGGKSDGRKVKVLRFNNGGKYTSKEFKDYLAIKDIKHQLSISERPEQNGEAECMNRTQSVPTVSDYRLTCQKNLGQWR